jgi:hypothetical protein
MRKGGLSAQYRNRHMQAIAPLSGSACSASSSPSESSSAVGSCGRHRLLALCAGRDPPDASRSQRTAPGQRFGDNTSKTLKPLRLVILAISVSRPILRLALEVPIETMCGRPPSLWFCAGGRGPQCQQRTRSLDWLYGHCQSHFPPPPRAGVGESSDSFARAFDAQAKRPTEEDVAQPPTARRCRLSSEESRETALRQSFGGISEGPCPGTRSRKWQERRQGRLEIVGVRGVAVRVLHFPEMTQPVRS